MLQKINAAKADDGSDGESTEEDNQQELDAERARQADQIRFEKTERLRKALEEYRLEELEQERIRMDEQRARIEEESEGMEEDESEGMEEDEDAGENRPGKSKKNARIAEVRVQSSGNNKTARVVKKRMHSEKQEGVRKQPKRQKAETAQDSAVVRRKENASVTIGMRLRSRKN
jgi:hypothetical protein